MCTDSGVAKAKRANSFVRDKDSTATFVAAHGKGSIFVAPDKYSKSLLVVAHGKYSAAVIGVVLSK